MQKSLRQALVFSVAALLAAPPAPAGMTHSWPAEGNALDGVGMADGTLVGNVTYTPGFIGQGFELDGNDSAITFGIDVGNFGTSDFSVAFAIKADPSQTIEDILAKRDVCGFSPFWNIRISNAGTPSFELRENVTDTGLPAPVNVRDGAFHTVVFTREGSAMSAYIDGRFVDRKESQSIADPTNTAEMGVSNGACIGLDGTLEFVGVIDEIRLADTAEPYLLLGDFECGDGALNGNVTATDALATLKTAIGTGHCPDCVCDANNSGDITASDALLILQFSIGQPRTLNCPDCEF